MTIANDVQTGIHAKHELGAAKGCSHVLGVFFGTGVAEPPSSTTNFTPALAVLPARSAPRGATSRWTGGGAEPRHHRPHRPANQPSPARRSSWQFKNWAAVLAPGSGARFIQNHLGHSRAGHQTRDNHRRNAAGAHARRCTPSRNVVNFRIRDARPRRRVSVALPTRVRRSDMAACARISATRKSAAVPNNPPPRTSISDHEIHHVREGDANDCGMRARSISSMRLSTVFDGRSRRPQ